MKKIQLLRHSILARLGLVMAAIAILAVSSMSASLYVADTIQGSATAINESGALRMRSYRIASSLVYELPDDEHWQSTQILIEEFKQHLHSEKITSNLPEDPSNNIHLAYKTINEKWDNDIEPLFDLYLDGIRDRPLNNNSIRDMSISENAVTNIRNQYFLVITDFVSKIDHLVNLLEEDTEAKIKNLRLYQYISLVLTLLLVVSTLILVYKRVHLPMKQLLAGSQQVSKRDFSYRTNYTRNDELGQLGIAFNTMAEDLSAVYEDLEERVNQKTIDLERSNSSMELLYTTVKRLNEASSPQDTFTDILKDIEKYIGTGKGSICLRNQKSEYAAMLASTLTTKDNDTDHCHNLSCHTCIGNGDSHLVTVKSNNNNDKHIISIPISDMSQQYGILMMEPSANKIIEPWQQKVLESISTQIAIAINLSHQEAETRRFSLIEERGAIARDLHDSLAQSLTYMKIQVSRLQAILKKSNHDGSPNKESDVVIDDLKTGLNSAYRQLRELLTTFRLKIDGNDFNEALQKTINEFNDRNIAAIKLTNQIAYYDLSPNEEIHIMQLVREALSNIIQHSKATEATVKIMHQDKNKISICIEDNGIGIADIATKKHHYGLSIMKERAETLNGSLEIASSIDAGTTLYVTFEPENIISPVNTKRA